jgi:predicted nuclease with TOPRIM domain
MTDQTPENTISPAIVQSAFAESYGIAIGRLTFEKIELERRVQELQAQLQVAITNGTQLKAENTKLIEAHIAHEGQIHSLQKQLDARPIQETVEKLEAKIAKLIKDGPTLEQSANLGLARAEARKEIVCK